MYAGFRVKKTCLHKLNVMARGGVCVCVCEADFLEFHVTGLAFLRLQSCDKLKYVLLWTASFTGVGVASVIHSQVNKHIIHTSTGRIS